MLLGSKENDITREQSHLSFPSHNSIKKLLGSELLVLKENLLLNLPFKSCVEGWKNIEKINKTRLWDGTDLFVMQQYLTKESAFYT